LKEGLTGGPHVSASGIEGEGRWAGGCGWTGKVGWAAGKKRNRGRGGGFGLFFSSFFKSF
jgi:hypothetical protein